jgi:hypothetical protein
MPGVVSQAGAQGEDLRSSAKVEPLVKKKLKIYPRLDRPKKIEKRRKTGRLCTSFFDA